MCPEFERHEREYQNNSDRWERFPGTYRINPSKAVKAFHRPAAGNDQPLPSDVRPPEILKNTLDYLFKKLLPSESLFETHGFIRDRTRSVRQDFTLQNERGQIAIECHERIARYHILCLHFLREKEGTGSFQEQQELEQVRKVLQSLNEFYDDFRGSNCFWPNEGEFRAYYLLTHLRDSDATRATERLPLEVFNDQNLQCAMELQVLAQCGNMTRGPARRPANSPTTLNAFSRLFKKVKSSETSFLNACLLETHFTDIRIAALKSLRSAQATKYGTKLSLSEVARLCAMSLQECYDFCTALGIKSAMPDNLEECTLELHKHAPFDGKFCFAFSCLDYLRCN
ncbi:SAC3/GANP/Nin1/mts3/eIF-3 p25 family-domain-containing protein [Phakopsora pachyrhizi]|nr:SAC3/GANP/Nin1/mts3/eIF-3 p25 family-domain-containing protein [Phakopsora pachyrhizi]